MPGPHPDSDISYETQESKRYLLCCETIIEHKSFLHPETVFLKGATRVHIVNYFVGTLSGFNELVNISVAMSLRDLRRSQRTHTPLQKNVYAM